MLLLIAFFAVWGPVVLVEGSSSQCSSTISATEMLWMIGFADGLNDFAHDGSSTDEAVSSRHWAVAIDIVDARGEIFE
jgi:hypothetical protein